MVMKRFRLHTILSKLQTAFCSDHASTYETRMMHIGFTPHDTAIEDIPISNVAPRFRDFYTSLADDHLVEAFHHASEAASQHICPASDAQIEHNGVFLTQKTQLATKCPQTKVTSGINGSSKGKTVRFVESAPVVIVIPEQFVTVVEQEDDDHKHQQVENRCCEKYIAPQLAALESVHD